jgi:hypothetical protein
MNEDPAHLCIHGLAGREREAGHAFGEAVGTVEDPSKEVKRLTLMLS